MTFVCSTCRYLTSDVGLQHCLPEFSRSCKAHHRIFGKHDCKVIALPCPDQPGEPQLELLRPCIAPQNMGDACKIAFHAAFMRRSQECNDGQKQLRKQENSQEHEDVIRMTVAVRHVFMGIRDPNALSLKGAREGQPSCPSSWA